MIRPIALSEPGFAFHPLTPSSVNSLSLYAIACGIFRQLAMTLQYTVILGSILFRHCWRWLVSSIQIKHQHTFAMNIAHLKALPQCLATAYRPLSKENYQEVGRSQGLRITHDIIYRPASGLCLGITLTFLSHYLWSEDNPTFSLLAAAQGVQLGGTETSVKIQALYDALMGREGRVSAQEKVLFCRLFKGQTLSSSSIQNKELLTSIQAFMSSENGSETLREFVLDDLENQEVEITPDLYALILELDFQWHLQQYPQEKKNDSFLNAVIQTVAHQVQLEIVDTTRLKGKISLVNEQLEALQEGVYLIQFAQHTVALVKTSDCIALLDPSEGMALLVEDHQQEEAISHLLHYYGNDDRVALKVIALQRKNSLNVK